MDTNKPMALRLADKYEHEGFLSDHKFAQNQWCSHAAVELRRLHAENEALSNKLQTFEALGGAVDDLQLLRMGYAAARLEIATNKKHAAIAAKTLETYKQSGVDFAARVHALERTADKLREENAALQQRDDDWHKEHSNALVEIARLKAAKADARHDKDDLTARDESQRLRIAELEAQLAAIGAGGVEPLRKRECLHQIGEPDHFRDATKMVQSGAPVALPAPDAVLRFERSTAGKENEMPSVVSCNWLPDGEYKLYTEQQVRALLMHRKLND